MTQFVSGVALLLASAIVLYFLRPRNGVTYGLMRSETVATWTALGLTASLTGGAALCAVAALAQKQIGL
ncbi:MAG: hypothetical protein KIT36_16575 [Alphaproteobacteria bacterium]|nr:hypothetical protein [Alphaproteobacteria bacterium]